MWTCWNVTPRVTVVELDHRLTPVRCGLELELLLGPCGISRAVWRLEDGRPLRRVTIARA